MVTASWGTATARTETARRWWTGRTAKTLLAGSGGEPGELGRDGTSKDGVGGGWDPYHTCAILDDDTLKCWGIMVTASWGTATPRIEPGPRRRRWTWGAGARRRWCRRRMVILARYWTTIPCDDGDWTTTTSPEMDLGSGARRRWCQHGTRTLWAVTRARYDAKCWGNNRRAEGQPRGEATAVDLGSGRTAKMVSAGVHHTCAILDDDTLKCWGNNGNGQLGIGGLTSSNSVDFGSGRTVKSASAGGYHTCAVLSDESTWCWGSNSNGEVGEGSITSTFFLPSEVRFSSSSSTPSPSTGSPGAGTPGPPGPRGPPAPPHPPADQVALPVPPARRPPVLLRPARPARLWRGRRRRAHHGG